MFKKVMKFELRCVCCGGSDFEPRELPLETVDQQDYMFHDDTESADNQVVCKYCGLEDYIANLTVGVYCTEKDIQGGY